MAYSGFNPRFANRKLWPAPESTHELAGHGAYNRDVDPISLFYLSFVESDRLNGWLGFVGTPAYTPTANTP